MSPQPPCPLRHPFASPGGRREPSFPIGPVAHPAGRGVLVPSENRTAGRRPGRFRAWLAVVLLSQAGCSVARLSTPERLEKGLVIVLPGIEGRSPWNVNLARGLDQAGLDCAIEIFDWGTPIPGGWLLNLTDLERNRAVAQKLRDRILRYRQDYPGRPIHLVGHSGGAGIALMATEKLPPEAPITGEVLLGAAVSPDYDLRPALRRVAGALHNCYSPLDTVYLGAGTVLAGTIDRRHVAAAGQVGFRLPEATTKNEDRALYAKLRQWQWTPEMRPLGHDGGHLGWTDRRFARDWIAAILADDMKTDGCDPNGDGKRLTARRPDSKIESGPQPDR